MGKHIRLRDRTKENDIKYAGFLSYRHLRIIGWVTLALAQIAVIFNTTMKVNPTTVGTYTNAYNFFNFFSGIAVPLFLIANFAAITQKRGNWKRLLLFYGGMALGMYIIANIVILHYAYGILNALKPTDLYESTKLFASVLASMGSTGYTLNIFIDLFLCSLIYFLLNYQPKKFFQGKSVIFLRLLILLPLAFEVVGMMLKFKVAAGTLVIPTFVMFLLPSKPPLIFMAFVVIFLIMKIIENNRLKKHGYSQEDLQEYLNTNAHTLLTSIYMCIVFAICIPLDIACWFGFGYVAAEPYIELLGEEIAFQYGMSVAYSSGFGASLSLAVVIPLVLLFSYKKTHENTKIDTFLPVIGIGIIALIYLEGTFQIIVNNIPYFKYKLNQTLGGLGGGEEPGEDPGATEALFMIKNTLFKIVDKVDTWITM